MGIQGFQKWLLGSFPEVVRVQGVKFGQHYDHVAFDMNQILHTAARRATDRQSLAFSIFRELDQILKNCVPRKSIFFAFDGPGPLAKLLTQRKRRNKARKEHTESSAGSSRRSKYAKPTIDRLEFTPGVDLQYFVRDATEYWAYSRLQNDSKYRDIDIRISGSDVAGEGELKLIDFCRAANLPITDSIVVVGGDADIVLQGLATVPVRNFFVYLRKFGGSRKKRSNYVISVWELARTLERLFPNESSGVRIDFILFSILNGNDYIPKIRGVTLGRLWRRYLLLKGSTTSGDAPFKGQCVVDAEKRTFNWALFHALIGQVGVPVRSLETEFGDEEEAANGAGATAANSRVKVTQAHLCFDDSDEDLGERILYTGNEEGIPMSEHDEKFSINSYEENGVDEESESDDDWEDDPMEDEPDDDVVDEDERHLEHLVAISGNASKFFDTERWFRALLWTLQMYIDGYCSDFSFQYGKPYGPSCEVLSKYINDHNGDPFVLQAPVSNALPLLPHQAAVAMLPRHAVHLLPEPLRRLVDDQVLSKEIFQANDVVNIPAMLKAIDSIPESEYTLAERKRTKFGEPFLLRRPRHHDHVGRSNPVVSRPGPKFEVISPRPLVFRKVFTVTSSPPCYPWPRGSFRNMLDLPYARVAGGRLSQGVRTQTDVAGNPSQAPHIDNPRSGRGGSGRASHFGNGKPSTKRRRGVHTTRGYTSRPGRKNARGGQ